jgi:hypothetical protein
MATGAMVKSYREVAGDRLILNLHPGQVKVWESRARFIAMMAGTQGGKTCLGVDWLRREIAKRGPGDYLAVTATFPLLEMKMLPEFRYVFEELLKLGSFAETKRIFTFNDGLTRVIFASATNPESIESATAKAAWLDEAGQQQFKRETWEAVQRRLSLNQGRVLFTTTLYGLGWFKTEVYDRAKAGDRDYEVVQFNSLLNPAFPREEYERAQNTLPRWKFDLFYRGVYTTPAGLIYDCFNTSTNCIDAVPIGKEWPHYVGHDFGGANPAAVFFAQDPATGYFYAYQEYLPGPGRSTAQHVEEFKRLTAGYNVIKRAGGSHQEDEIRQGYAAHGWPIQEPLIRDVEAGIDRVYGLIKRGKVFIFKGLAHLIDEITTYSRKLDDKYNPTNEIEDKSSYHLLDATRYILSDFRPETVISIRRFRTTSWF